MNERNVEMTPAEKRQLRDQLVGERMNIERDSFTGFIVNEKDVKELDALNKGISDLTEELQLPSL